MSCLYLVVGSPSLSSAGRKTSAAALTRAIVPPIWKCSCYRCFSFGARDVPATSLKSGVRKSNWSLALNLNDHRAIVSGCTRLGHPLMGSDRTYMKSLVVFSNLSQIILIVWRDDLTINFLDICNMCFRQQFREHITLSCNGYRS